jgi:hypothetical protein
VAAHITETDLRAWADGNKIVVPNGSLDTELEKQVAAEVIAGCAPAYDTTTWVDTNSTPELVKKAIAMTYLGWFIQRTYSEDADTDAYAVMLLAAAQRLVTGIATGTTVLTDVPTGTSLSADTPLFYPTDASSMTPPIPGVDTSLGGPVFSMGDLW